MNNQPETTASENKAKKGKKFSLNVIVDYVVKFLPIITTVFVAFAIINIFYEGLSGIVSAISSLVDGLGFMSFVRSLFGGLENAVSGALKYVFYAVVTGCFSKILNRK